MFASKLLLYLSLTASALSYGADTEVNPVRKPRPEVAAVDVQKLIVRLRDESPDVAAVEGSMKRGDRGTERAVAVAQRARLTLEKSHELVAGMHAVQVRAPGAGEPLAKTLARLRADPEVAYAEPDYRRHVLATPDDPLFQTQQWHLKNDVSTPSAIDALSAWDTTQGRDDIVIAVVDTGVRFDHPDLKRVAAAGRLLDGYDFVADAEVANDGDGRDADASDPGDWCQGSSSSWHGTLVSGIVGALTNNATGIAGIVWQGRILPVRALGKCGGDDSDVIAATLWAAGIHVNGIPDNPNPARIINLSLGSSGSCPASWQDAISQIVARGVLVVVAAGNDSGPVGSPANCPGVAAVSALRHAGTKVGFSSLGREVALGAPGGNCVNASGACLYSIDSTSNDGVTTPGANTYTDQTNFNVGTSFSAPIVAGIAALMAAVNDQLDSAQLISRLQSGAKPYPKSPDTNVLDCHVPAGGSDLQPGECNCTTDTCGAGMANAYGSVIEALRPVAVPTADPHTVASGQMVTLDGSGSFASNNRSIVSYAWTVASATGVVPVITNSDQPNASFTATTNGDVMLRLTVTDSEGAQDSAVVDVSAPAGVVVTVSPGVASVPTGGTQLFTATVEHTLNTAVIWQVSGVTGGNASVGTISTSGLYTAPATVPASATVTVSAISSADNTRLGSAQVTITRRIVEVSGGGGGGGGGGAIDGAWLLACLLALLSRWTLDLRRLNSPPRCRLAASTAVALAPLPQGHPFLTFTRNLCPLIASALMLGLAGCDHRATLPEIDGFGPAPTLPAPHPTLIPTVQIAPAKGWPSGTTPVAAAGLAVNSYAAGLDHPRWLYVLPNGDVLVAESNGPPRADDSRGIKQWVASRIMERAGASVPSANRITLLRDTDGDGTADFRSALLKGLNSPFGMALVGDHLYVANTDSVMRFPYAAGDTQIRAPGVRIVGLPAGPINNHWTRNIIASHDGSRLYVTVGSNSNVGENGMESEVDRAAILEVNPATGASRSFASGLRNPNGLDWEPHTGALWTTVNERDELGSDLVPDFMTSVRDGAFYGWPYSYFGSHVDVRVKPQRPDLVARAVAPDYALGAHTASLGLVFYRGTLLPRRFSGGAFIGQHGSWNRQPLSGYKVIFVAFEDGRPVGPPVDVLTGFVDAEGNALGRPAGVAVDRAGALLVADDVGNTVWRVWPEGS